MLHKMKPIVFKIPYNLYSRHSDHPYYPEFILCSDSKSLEIFHTFKKWHHAQDDLCHWNKTLLGYLTHSLYCVEPD